MYLTQRIRGLLRLQPSSNPDYLVLRRFLFQVEIIDSHSNEYTPLLVITASVTLGLPVWPGPYEELLETVS